MMNDKDLKRNGSGYVDEPCYKAVTAPPRPGEIWIHGKSGAQMLVLANVNGVCSTLRLTDTGGEGAIPVMSRTPMYSKPAMISYCFEDLLTTFVKSVKGDEMKTVRKAVVRALGLNDIANDESAYAEEARAMKEELDSLKAGYLDVCHENESLKKNLVDAQKTAADAKSDLEAKNMADKMVADAIAGMQEEITRLTIFKDMYMDIIAKLVALRGGTANE